MTDSNAVTVDAITSHLRALSKVAMDLQRAKDTFLLTRIEKMMELIEAKTPLILLDDKRTKASFKKAQADIQTNLFPILQNLVDAARDSLRSGGVLFTAAMSGDYPDLHMDQSRVDKTRAFYLEACEFVSLVNISLNYLER